ncbi:hypothetical protein ASE21_04495 [Flavobacterium sp. Root901]|uniref:hypothetical protein n=1 Tax=Flavobacterium sp. Root901 TaxID=1736605 RepID=UPI000708F14C|nr:hypothetical protein [Flavobacterium sp. Root901]KRD10987.1 hypothetical protein ASE21_04495 [Flavobacterium sp. Root901]
MKNYQKKSAFLILFGLFINIYVIHSQTNNDVNIYNWFDKTVGKNNLDLNNGVPHINPYRSVGDSHLYLTNKYEIGKIDYDGQKYYEVKLKYDIYRDILVLNPYGESENVGINLNQSKVEAFSIQDKNFIKIDKKSETVAEFTPGYYEESKITEDFTFYIKYHKDIQKTVSENGILYSFKENNTFFINLKNNIYLIRGKSDIVKLFPDQKKQINGFYLMNRELQKSDLNQFMKNLMKYISNSLAIKTN